MKLTKNELKTLMTTLEEYCFELDKTPSNEIDNKKVFNKYANDVKAILTKVYDSDKEA